MPIDGVISAPPSVTCANAPEVLQALSAAGGADLDLAGCETFDSALIAVLLELRRRASRAGTQPPRALNPPANLRKLAALYGVDGILFDERH